MPRISLSAKLVLLTSILVILLTSALTISYWRRGYQSLEERFGLVLKHIAINTALQIDPVKHSRISSKNDAHTASFRDLHAVMLDAMKANYLTPETFYTFNIDKDHQLRFAVMLQEKKFIGHRYEIPAVNKQNFEKVMRGESLFTGIYEDQHGAWISGLAPIMLAGRVTGVVEADFHVDKFLAELKQQTLQTIEFSLLILILAILVIIYLSRRITSPILELNKAAAAIAQGDVGESIRVSRRDEIGELQASFNAMQKSIGERYLMLKYLSPHTKRMIEEEIHNPQIQSGQVRNVVLLFSDIRGFTRYSEKRDPREVIMNLNTLLGKQAEIIEAFGGDIDKFVGDEIIAIFEGDLAEQLAVKAALEIQKMVSQNHTGLSFDPVLKVGIGIASGEVMMGNIGSAGRQDFTIIGSNVNLAARICSAAAADEILLSSHVYYALQREIDAGTKYTFDLKRKGNLKAKGFSELIPLYTCEQVS
ncbi:MAG: adenylate/guanylate cyclase domain-containing protein [Spirochaetota bacterium]